MHRMDQLSSIVGARRAVIEGHERQCARNPIYIHVHIKRAGMEKGGILL